jgi:hypothetical protein
MICDYGCGKESIKTLKNGKHCCSENTSSCPAMKTKNSEKVKNKRSDLGNNYWKNGHPKGNTGHATLRGKTYEDIYGLEQSLIKRKKLSESLTGNLSYQKMSKEKKEIHSSSARTRIVARYEAGWLPKAGRCKKYRYFSPIAGEVLLDGTWELAVAKWLDTNEYNWKRNTKRFQYINLKGKISFYTPDFWVDEFNSYLEIKGYETAIDRCKWSQFTAPLIIWKKKELFEHNILD